MADDNVLKGSTEGPYEQFDMCEYDVECKHKNKDGRCIFETCIVQNELPPTTECHCFQCVFCTEFTTIRPNRMRIYVCEKCLERIVAVEKKPFTCVFCGKSQHNNSKIPLSGICDTCFGALNNAINCKRCGN